MDKIYIVGYMGAGKTTAAKRLAHRLGWEVADTDALFEEKYRISIDDFFQKYDEPLYRKLESEILKSTESLDKVVISTGGGTACYFDNMDWMNQHGLTVFMRISPAAAVDRDAVFLLKQGIGIHHLPAQAIGETLSSGSLARSHIPYYIDSICVHL